MGTRVTRAAPHFPVEEVKQRMNRDPRFWVRQRWWIIYQALIAPRKAEEIAKHTGVSVPTVRRVISGYNRLGLAALETPGKGGRRHESVTVEQERELLAPFFARAERGEIATAGEIKQVFEAQVGARRWSDPHDLSLAASTWVAQAGSASAPSQGHRGRTSDL
jgi:Helix-turn-helix domain